MKRLVALMVSVLMMLGICASAQAVEYTGNMVKLSEEPITLSCFMTFDSSRFVTVTSYAELPCQLEMADKTNVTINYIHPTAGSEKEQLNLLISSGDLPDIIYYNWSNFSSSPDQLYEDGLIIDLNDYVDAYCPNLKAIWEEIPDAKRNMVTDNGILPGFNQMQFSEPLKNTYCYLIRADWLEAVGLDAPVTLDDWYEMLCAFRDNDMDGDGDPTNEIPMTSGYDINDDVRAVEGMYAAWGKDWKMHVSADNRAAYGAYDPDYKDYLLLMNKWMNEGLIDPDFATNDKTQQDAKFLNSKAGALRSGMGAGFGTFISGFGDEDIIVAAMSPVMNEGDTSYNFSGYSAGVTKSAAVITTACETPEIAAMYLDMFFGGDGMMLANYGIEGESYNMVDGYPTLVDYIMRNPDGKSINVALSEFSLGAAGFPFWNDSALREQRMMSYAAQREAGLRMAQMDNSRILPNISLSTDEINEYSSIMGDVETYVKEMTIAFILGKKDIEGEFDSYMNTLKGMGVERAIEIYNDALTRYYQR